MSNTDYCGVIIDGRLVSFREWHGFDGRVVISDGVTEIGNGAFEVAYCGIKTVIVPSTVTKIGKRAFACCELLQEIVIPEGVETIGDEAFYNCHSLKKINIPSSVTSIGANAFCNCGDLEEITVGADNPVYRGAGNCLIETKKKLLLRGCKNSVIPADGSVTTIGDSAFSNDSAHPRNNVHSKGITEIVIPEGITKICKYAFEFNFRLESVVLPDSVKTIEKRAFMRCYNLKSIELGNGVQVIGDSAFEYDEKLNIELTLPSSLTKLGTYAFYHSGITGLKVGGNLKTIGKNAFRKCQSLKSIEFFDGATEVGEEMFSECDALETVELAPTVKTVGKCAFFCCEKLKKISFCDGLETIAEDAFRGCDALESVELPDSVKYIGNGAFAYCEKLSDVKLPAAVEFMGSGVFGGCAVKVAAPKKTGVVGFDIADNVLIKYKGKAQDVVIPDGVTKIAAKAFFNKKCVERITLPASLSSIANKAIERCENLKSISVASGNTAYRSVGNCLIDIKKKTVVYGFKDSEIPADGSVATIAANAFAGVALESLVVPAGVKTIASCAFKSCNKLKSITLPQSLKSIGPSAFKYCTALERVAIPESVTAIGVDAFAECTALTEISFEAECCGDLSVGGNTFCKAGKNTSGIAVRVGAKVQKLPCNLFASGGTECAPNITSVEFVENSVCASVGDEAFYQCVKLKTVELPDTLTSIGYYAFYCCYALESVNIPKGVTQIGTYAFHNCCALTEIVVPAGVTKLFGVFSGCGGLKSISVDAGNPVFHSDGNCLIDTEKKILLRGGNDSVIPSDGSVVRLDNYSFDRCADLTSIVVPDGVEEIYNNAFEGCEKLKSVEIAATVTYVCNPYFENCTSLESITATKELLEKYEYFGFKDKQFGPSGRRVKFEFL